MFYLLVEYTLCQRYQQIVKDYTNEVQDVYHSFTEDFSIIDVKVFVADRTPLSVYCHLNPSIINIRFLYSAKSIIDT